ncbi:MAG TPA: alcohol dehydrogenase catalytic domain-containing protein, partial [Acidimicrobiales bacterium]|nr:alcohol dehydrogenase catalytic domain-containing protein [Acidimicrobiales bacterium]
MVAKVVATAYGGPEVLALIDEPVAPPGPGQVLVEVRAAGVNPADYKRYGGAMGGDPAAPPPPIGLEASGVVVAVGSGAVPPSGPVAVGDEVAAFRVAGAYAAQVLVPAEAVVPKPPGLPFEAAGGLLVAGATAVHALTVTGVGAGDTVLVHGGAGGVGHLAVQLAVAAGARVIATGGPSSSAELRRLGAEPVTYGEGLV